MAAQRVMTAAWLATTLVLAAANGSHSGAARKQVKASADGRPVPPPPDSPVGKVLELLGELGSQLAEDKEADGKQFAKYSKWYQEEDRSASATIEDTEETVRGLESELEQQQALRDKLNLVVEKAIAKLAKAEKELKQATAQRGSEHKEFAAGEEDAEKAIQQLEHSLTVMGSTPNDQGAPESGASLVDVARKVRAVLLQGQDISLTLAQRETLDGFMRAAARRGRAASTSGGLRGATGDEALAPDFLQVSDATAGPYGEYQSQTSGVVSTLTTVLEKAKKHLEDLRTQEQQQSSDFKAFEEDLKRQIESIRAQLNGAKQQIAASEELSGKRKADLLAARELLKVTQDSLAKLQADFDAKNASFRERSAKREDEITAVQEATEIMTSRKMRQLMDEHYSAGAGTSIAFLQLHQAGRRRALHMLKEAKTPTVALVALRTQTRSMRSDDPADPFAKVSQLLKEMIARLTKEYGEELTKAQYCESEMAHSAKTKASIGKSADKLKAKIAQIDTEVDQLKADIKRIEGELKDMSRARLQATSLRQSEQAEATSSIVRYKDAQRLLKSALAVLKKTYGEKTAGGQGGDGSSSGYKVSGIGAGVVGLLEIATEDFAQLQQETETAEAIAAKDYKELMDSTEVKTASFNKDLEYKNREKVRLEGDRMRAAEDLQNFDKELAALEKYIEQLKVQCPKPESYEERKARREEEIRQLQDALAHLSNL